MSGVRVVKNGYMRAVGEICDFIAPYYYNTYYVCERILVDPTSNVRSSQRLSHACLSTY